MNMALNTNKELKLYYSISEVAEMFDVNESLLRFWEKEFPQIKPCKTSGGTRQYRKEDIETIKLIYHLVKKRNDFYPERDKVERQFKENTIRNFEIVEHLKSIKEELLNQQKRSSTKFKQLLPGYDSTRVTV